MHQCGDLGHVGAGAEQVGACGYRHQAGARRHHPGHIGRGQLRGLSIEVDRADGGSDGPGRLQPRPDVGVVVETAHHDLVAGGPPFGYGAGEVVGDLRLAPGTDCGSQQRRSPQSTSVGALATRPRHPAGSARKRGVSSASEAAQKTSPAGRRTGGSVGVTGRQATARGD